MTYLCNAQNNNTRFMNIQLGGHYSQSQLIDFASRYTAPTVNLPYTYDARGANGFSFSIGTEFRFNNHFRARLQGKYGTFKYQGIISGLSFGTDYDPATQTIKSSSKLQELHTVKLVSIPLSVMYFFDAKNKFYIGAGINSNFQLYQKVSENIKYGNGIVENGSNKVENDSKFFRSIAYDLFIGYKQKIYSDYTFSIEPFISFDNKKYVIDKYYSVSKFANWGVSTYLSKSISKKEAQCYHF